MTVALMVVLAAAAAAWVLAPLRGSVGRDVSRRAVPPAAHDAPPVAKRDALSAPVGDGTRHDASVGGGG